MERRSDVKGSEQQWNTFARRRERFSSSPDRAPLYTTIRDERVDRVHGRLGRPGLFVYLCLRAAGAVRLVISALRGYRGRL